jgi:hypothetical protein
VCACKLFGRLFADTAMRDVTICKRMNYVISLDT